MKTYLALAFFGLFSFFTALPAQAALPMTALGDDIQIAEAVTLNDQEMGELRAGFIDPSGFILKFAVDVKSHIDGALTFVRSLVLHHDHSGRFHAESKAEIIPQGLPENTEVKVVDNGAGIVVSNESDKTQTTTILNQVASGSFSNIILNTADNRNVSQTMNIDLVLQNIKSVVDQVAAAKTLQAPAGLYQMTRMHSVGFGM